MKALHTDLPATFPATREALHRVAEELVAPARKPHNEIALQRTEGGFGTPPFDFEGATAQVRVDGAELMLARDGVEERIALDSLAAAGERLGAGLLPDGVPADAEPLGIDPEAAARLADFYAFADALLRGFRESLPAGEGVSTINLWPEHFDLAFEAGDEASGRRANYGASPGDADHEEPYLYVGPWAGRPDDAGLWNATAFEGAELGYAELAAADDPGAAALAFFTSRHGALGGG